MSRSVAYVTLIAVLLAALAVTGCAGGKAGPNPAPAKNLSPADAPQNLSKMFDLNDYWYGVRYMKASLGTYEQYSDDSQTIVTLSQRFLDGQYQGLPAREWIVETTPVNEGRTEDDQYYFALRSSMDLYFLDRKDTFEFLGGNAKIDLITDPDFKFEGYVSPKLLKAEMTGDMSLFNQAADEMGYPDSKFSPEAMTGTPETYDIPEMEMYRMVFGGQKIEGKSILDYIESKNLTRMGSPGVDTLKVGDKYYECYVITVDYTPARDDESSVEFTFWYSPQIPATPLKYTWTQGDVNLVYRVEELETASDRMTH